MWQMSPEDYLVWSHDMIPTLKCFHHNIDSRHSYKTRTAVLVKKYEKIEKRDFVSLNNVEHQNKSFPSHFLTIIVGGRFVRYFSIPY